MRYVCSEPGRRGNDSPLRELMQLTEGSDRPGCDLGEGPIRGNDTKLAMPTTTDQRPQPREAIQSCAAGSTAPR